MKTKLKKIFFITGTDTDVGKTIVTSLLGRLMQSQGFDVGVMKPLQCGGDDAAFLKKSLNVKDAIETINPYFAQEPLSPNIAFKRKKQTISISKILKNFELLKQKHEILLVEGAGGIMVPIKKEFFMIDLMKEMHAEIIVVSRLGLGTINHTLLTVEQLRNAGLDVKGVIFNEAKKSLKGISEQTNPAIISKYGSTLDLGVVPYFSHPRSLSDKELKLLKIDIKTILRENKSQAKNLQEQDKKYVWHPFTQMKDWIREEQLVIDQAKGNTLIDVEGKKYLDGVSSLWTNVHGHRKKQIDAAIKKQINRLSHSTLLGLANTPSIELAKKLVAITPKGLEKVFYSDNGSTSVEIGIKIAYQYWQNRGEKQKTSIVHLANSYHGDTLGSVSVGGIDLFHNVYRKLIFKTLQLNFPDCYRAPQGKKYPDYAFECLNRFEKYLKKEHRTIAAMVVEPMVQGAAGMIIWPRGVFKRMEQLCRRYNIFLVVDEVATGFGRTGKMFACEHENVKPDILCLAKGLTGGYLPLAATLTTQKIFDGFLFDYKDQKTFFHGHTYTGNPLCCAAALASIEIFQKEKVLQKLSEKIKDLKQQLKRFRLLPFVGDVRQKGFMVGIELVKDKKTKEPFGWKEQMGVHVCQNLRRKGVILRPLGNVIVLMPPLSIAKRELKKIVDDLYEEIASVGRDASQTV